MSGLLDAAREGDLKEMQQLVKEGASIHEVGGLGINALMLAFINDHELNVH
jgi:hypothetical protein